MTVYAVKNDEFKYLTLDLEINDIIDFFPDRENDLQIHEFSRNNLSLNTQWQRFQTGWSKIEGEENLIPDITTWIDATLFLSPKAYRFLFDMLKSFGEFLPVHVDGEVYFIFNCLTLVGEDKEKTTHNELVFSEDETSDKLVFKNRKQFCLDTFCTERFKNAVESFGLRGLCFSTQLEIP